MPVDRAGRPFYRARINFKGVVEGNPLLESILAASDSVYEAYPVMIGQSVEY